MTSYFARKGLRFFQATHDLLNNISSLFGCFVPGWMHAKVTLNFLPNCFGMIKGISYEFGLDMSNPEEKGVVYEFFDKVSSVVKETSKGKCKVRMNCDNKPRINIVGDICEIDLNELNNAVNKLSSSPTSINVSDKQYEQRCAICLENVPSKMNVSCGHLCLCLSCSDELMTQPPNLHKCPICNKKIEKLVIVYHS